MSLSIVWGISGTFSLGQWTGHPNVWSKYIIWSFSIHVYKMMMPVKLMGPSYWNSAETTSCSLWRCQIVFLFPPKISQGNYDHVKLFSSFPYFQQFWRDHWCRFSQVLFVRGWTLCYTGKEEPALCVLAYRVKLKHYSYTVVLSSIYTTLPSLKAIWWQKHRAANHFNSPRVPPESGTFHPNLIWHMLAGRSSRSGSWKNRRLLRI